MELLPCGTFTELPPSGPPCVRATLLTLPEGKAFLEGARWRRCCPLEHSLEVWLYFPGHSTIGSCFLSRGWPCLYLTAHSTQEQSSPLTVLGHLNVPESDRLAVWPEAHHLDPEKSV